MVAGCFGHRVHRIMKKNWVFFLLYVHFHQCIRSLVDFRESLMQTSKGGRKTAAFHIQTHDEFIQTVFLFSSEWSVLHEWPPFSICSGCAGLKASSQSSRGRHSVTNWHQRPLWWYRIQQGRRWRLTTVFWNCLARQQSLNV